MKRLWGLALIAVIPWLIPWHPAAAATATEYGTMAGQKAAGQECKNLGTATSNKLGAVTQKTSIHKKKGKR